METSRGGSWVRPVWVVSYSGAGACLACQVGEGASVSGTEVELRRGISWTSTG